jgi:hypothetical protein
MTVMTDGRLTGVANFTGFTALREGIFFACVVDVKGRRDSAGELGGRPARHTLETLSFLLFLKRKFISIDPLFVTQPLTDSNLKYCIGFAQSVSRYRLGKHGRSATMEDVSQWTNVIAHC